LKLLRKDTDIYVGQIYTFLFGARPFQCFGLDFLVEGMIDFVEGLPTEWQQKWDDIRLNSGHDYSTSKLTFNVMLVGFFKT
jgi:hypothetical protein